MYTQWYAYGMMFDIPGRPHVENLCNCKETAPDRIGNFSGNLANTRLRYSLVPYLYSLAHRAYRHGEPVMPPLVMYYQTDNNVRSLGHEKLIGRDLLAAIVARHGETGRDVYLPRGTWFDWHTGRRISSEGIMLPNVPVANNGAVTLPLYARAGALIPLMRVDENTLNALGERRGGELDTTLVVRAFPLDGGVAAESEFTLYEDDGKTIAYQAGAVRTTAISQRRVGDNELSVTVAASQGSYDGAPQARDVLTSLVTSGRAEGVMLNGTPLPERASLEDFQASDSGWTNANPTEVLAKSGSLPVGEAREFRFALAPPPLCTSNHQVIVVPGEGNGWNPADTERALNNCVGKRWQGRIVLYEEEYKFAADNSFAVNWGSDGKQDGPNFMPLAEAGTYEVIFDEDNAANPIFNRVGPAPAKPLRFVCENGDTVPGTSVYVVGSIPELGVWEPKNAIKLQPNGPYPTWTGNLANLPTDVVIEWKCIKRLEQGDPPAVVQWEPGSNNVVDRSQTVQTGVF